MEHREIIARRVDEHRRWLDTTKLGVLQRAESNLERFMQRDGLGALLNVAGACRQIAVVCSTEWVAALGDAPIKLLDKAIRYHATATQIELEVFYRERSVGSSVPAIVPLKEFVRLPMLLSLSALRSHEPLEKRLWKDLKILTSLRRQYSKIDECFRETPPLCFTCELYGEHRGDPIQFEPKYCSVGPYKSVLDGLHSRRDLGPALCRAADMRLTLIQESRKRPFALDEPPFDLMPAELLLAINLVEGTEKVSEEPLHPLLAPWVEIGAARSEPADARLQQIAARCEQQVGMHLELG